MGSYQKIHSFAIHFLLLAIHFAIHFSYYRPTSVVLKWENSVFASWEIPGPASFFYYLSEFPCYPPCLIKWVFPTVHPVFRSSSSGQTWMQICINSNFPPLLAQLISLFKVVGGGVCVRSSLRTLQIHKRTFSVISHLCLTRITLSLWNLEHVSSYQSSTEAGQIKASMMESDDPLCFPPLLFLTKSAF